MQMSTSTPRLDSACVRPSADLRSYTKGENGIQRHLTLPTAHERVRLRTAVWHVLLRMLGLVDTLRPDSARLLLCEGT